MYINLVGFENTFFNAIDRTIAVLTDKNMSRADKKK